MPPPKVIPKLTTTQRKILATTSCTLLPLTLPFGPFFYIHCVVKIPCIDPPYSLYSPRSLMQSRCRSHFMSSDTRSTPSSVCTHSTHASSTRTIYQYNEAGPHSHNDHNDDHASAHRSVNWYTSILDHRKLSDGSTNSHYSCEDNYHHHQD